MKRPEPPRLALRQEEAAAALGMSPDSFVKYVLPHMPVVRCGSLRIYPVAHLEAWLAENAERPLEAAA